VSGTGGARSLAFPLVLFDSCFCVFGKAVDARSQHDRQGWAMPWPLGQMVSRRISAARNNLIEEKPSRSDEQAGWDRPALTGSRDDLRGVAREGFPTEQGETHFESSSCWKVGDK
jgi:hypothetical protein